MGNTTVDGLRAKSDEAWGTIGRQLEGMNAHIDRSDAPGEWTVRQVLAHLLLAPGGPVGEVLKRFGSGDLALIEIAANHTDVSGERGVMTLAQLSRALDAQRREVFLFLNGLSEADVQTRKARIPVFKQYMGTDEIPLAVFVGGMWDFHWRDHAGQLAKIRAAAGLRAAP
jgi:hypothetical protein